MNHSGSPQSGALSKPSAEVSYQFDATDSQTLRQNTQRGRALQGEAMVRYAAAGLRRVRAFAKEWRQNRERATTIRRLSALDDRMLKDIGLLRGEIGLVADSLQRQSAHTALETVRTVRVSDVAPVTLTGIAAAANDSIDDLAA